MALSRGPIVGHTTRNATTVWLRGEPESVNGGQVHLGAVDLYRDGVFAEARCVVLSESADHTGVVTFDGLVAETNYEVRCDALSFAAGELPQTGVPLSAPLVQAGIGRTGTVRTAPPIEARRLRFAFGSCRYLNWRKTNSKHLAKGDETFGAMYAAHQDRPLDFVLMLGDQIYGDAWGTVAPWPVKPTQREDYLTAYRKAFGQPNIADLMAHVPTYMTLDDHEVFDGWPSGVDGDEQELVAIARAAYEAYEHSHNPQPLSSTPDSYAYEFTWGAFPFFVMDTRTGRAGDQTMLGAPQFAAFEAWLARNHDAPVLFVATSVGIFPDRKDSEKGDDRWAGYRAERHRLLEAIRLSGVGPVVFLAGDVHNTHFATMTCHHDAGFRAVALTSSPFYTYKLPFLSANFSTPDMYAHQKEISRPLAGAAPSAVYRYESGGYVAQNGFTVVDIDLSGPTSVCTATALSADGVAAPGYPFDFTEFCFPPQG